MFMKHAESNGKTQDIEIAMKSVKKLKLQGVGTLVLGSQPM